MSAAELSPSAAYARCVCSTLGYEHPLWNADYYPEECPEEWHLAYFMNDFQAVCLPATDWSSRPAQLEAIARELEDDRFELVLEWPDTNSVVPFTQLRDSVEKLREHIACIVLDMDRLPAAPLREICAGLGARFPINFLCLAPDAEQRAYAQNLSAGFVWIPGRSASLIPGDRYQVVRLPCLGLREMKPVLQQIRSLLDRGVRVGIFLDAHAQAPQRALEIRTMIELMGLA